MVLVICDRSLPTCLSTQRLFKIGEQIQAQLSMASNVTLPAMVSSKSSGSPAAFFTVLTRIPPLLRATAITDPETMGLEDAFGRPRRAATWEH